MSFASWLPRRPSNQRSASEPARFRPRLESLGERALPSFLVPHNYSDNSEPAAMATADLNGDGALDLITAGNDSVSVLLGGLDKHHRPTGSFSAGVAFSIGESPSSLAVGDFDGNGKIDVVTGNGDGSFTVLWGGGVDETDFVVGASGQMTVPAGDFNGDGRLDFATASQNGYLDVWLSDAAGVIVSGGRSVAPAAGLAALVVGDFTGDGRLDVATAAFFGTAVSVLPGDGDGTLGAARTTTLDPEYPLGWGSNILASGDFNGDGTLDLAATSPSRNVQVTDDGGGQVNVLLGTGDGTFASGQTLRIQYWEPQAVAAADFNGDGHPDLVTADHLGIVDVWLGTGDGTFLPTRALDVGYFDHMPLSLVAADFNGDGLADAAEGYFPGDFPYQDVEVLLNDGQWGGGNNGKGHIN